MIGSLVAHSLPSGARCSLAHAGARRTRGYRARDEDDSPVGDRRRERGWDALALELRRSRPGRRSVRALRRTRRGVQAQGSSRGGPGALNAESPGSLRGSLRPFGCSLCRSVAFGASRSRASLTVVCQNRPVGSRRHRDQRPQDFCGRVRASDCPSMLRRLATTRPLARLRGARGEWPRIDRRQWVTRRDSGGGSSWRDGRRRGGYLASRAAPEQRRALPPRQPRREHPRPGVVGLPRRRRLHPLGSPLRARQRRRLLHRDRHEHPCGQLVRRRREGRRSM